MHFGSIHLVFFFLKKKRFSYFQVDTFFRHKKRGTAHLESSFREMAHSDPKSGLQKGPIPSFGGGPKDQSFPATLTRPQGFVLRDLTDSVHSSALHFHDPRLISPRIFCVFVRSQRTICRSTHRLHENPGSSRHGRVDLVRNEFFEDVRFGLVFRDHYGTVGSIREELTKISLEWNVWMIKLINERMSAFENKVRDNTRLRRLLFPVGR